MAAGFVIKGIFIGLLFGIPVGAVGTLTVQMVISILILFGTLFLSERFFKE